MCDEAQAATGRIFAEVLEFERLKNNKTGTKAPRRNQLGGWKGPDRRENKGAAPCAPPPPARPLRVLRLVRPRALRKTASNMRSSIAVTLLLAAGLAAVSADEGADDDEKDEIESGSAEPDILPEGNEDQLAKRVEAIRSKYRAPVDSSARRRESSGGLKVD